MAPVNDEFAEFARGFRERTAARLLEFEKAMAKAQDELEKSAEKATARAHMAKQSPQSQTERRHLGQGQVAQNPAAQRYIGTSGQDSSSSRRGNRQVKSVLRRGN